MNMNPTHNISLTANKRCAAKATFLPLLVDMAFLVNRNSNVGIRNSTHGEIFDSNRQIRICTMRRKRIFEQVSRIVKSIVRIDERK